MDIKYEIEPVFKIEFFKIECIDFKNKKKKLEKVLARYPEMPQANFGSNRGKCSINIEFREAKSCYWASGSYEDISPILTKSSLSKVNLGYSYMYSNNLFICS